MAADALAADLLKRALLVLKYLDEVKPEDASLEQVVAAESVASKVINKKGEKLPKGSYDLKWDSNASTWTLKKYKVEVINQSNQSKMELEPTPDTLTPDTFEAFTYNFSTDNKNYTDTDKNETKFIIFAVKISDNKYLLIDELNQQGTLIKDSLADSRFNLKKVIGCLDKEACNYNSNAEEDSGDCLYYDECGVCGGNGIEEGKCDCAGNEYDDCGVCGGDNTTCAGCDGIPNSGKTLDDCGICGGNGYVDDCGICNGNNNCEKHIDLNKKNDVEGEIDSKLLLFGIGMIAATKLNVIDKIKSKFKLKKV